MLTDPKAPREAELPELHDVTGLSTADLVSRNVGMTERWYAEPELGKILIYFHTDCVVYHILYYRLYVDWKHTLETLETLDTLETSK